MMRRAALSLICLAALGACDKGKPRHPPVDTMANLPPISTPAASPSAGLSAGLTHLPGVPGFSLDRIGEAPDPLNRKPAVTPAGQPTVFAGFAFDPLAKAPAKGVDMVVDGKTYVTAYGVARTDVAIYFKSGALTNVGYTVTLPALTPGEHSAMARVVAADGKGYFESPAYLFTVK